MLALLFDQRTEKTTWRVLSKQAVLEASAERGSRPGLRARTSRFLPAHRLGLWLTAAAAAAQG
eukprot:3442861-Rhodomonas_salina.1